MLDRPVLHQRWEYPKSVFDELSGSRRYTSGGPANIPFSEFHVYAVAHGFSGQDLIEVWDDLRLVDNCWLAEVAKQQEAKQEGRS